MDCACSEEQCCFHSLLAGASQGRHSRIHSTSDLAAMQCRNASPHVRPFPFSQLLVAQHLLKSDKHALSTGHRTQAPCCGCRVLQTKTVRWSNNGLAKAPASAPAASAAINQMGMGNSDAQPLQHPLQLQQQQPPPPQPGLAQQHAPTMEAFPGKTTTGFSLPDGQAWQPAGQERAGSGGALPTRMGLRGNPPDQ